MSCGSICYLRMWRHLFTATCRSIAGLPRLRRWCLGCPIGHCPKKKIHKIKKPQIQKSKKFVFHRSPVQRSIFCVGGTPFCGIFFSFTFSVHSRCPTFCWGSPICVVLFSFVVRCPVPCSSVIVMVPHFVLINRRFVGGTWCIIWHINLHLGRKTKIQAPLFCVVDSLEVNCSSWRLSYCVVF